MSTGRAFLLLIGIPLQEVQARFQPVGTGMHSFFWSYNEKKKKIKKILGYSVLVYKGKEHWASKGQTGFYSILERSLERSWRSSFRGGFKTTDESVVLLNCCESSSAWFFLSKSFKHCLTFRCLLNMCGVFWSFSQGA